MGRNEEREEEGETETATTGRNPRGNRRRRAGETPGESSRVGERDIVMSVVVNLVEPPNRTERQDVGPRGTHG